MITAEQTTFHNRASQALPFSIEDENFVGFVFPPSFKPQADRHIK